jgi:hypothetical protein
LSKDSLANSATYNELLHHLGYRNVPVGKKTSEGDSVQLIHADSYTGSAVSRPFPELRSLEQEFNWAK